MTNQGTSQGHTHSKPADRGRPTVSVDCETIDRLVEAMGKDAFSKWVIDFCAGKTRMSAEQLTWMLDALGEENFRSVVGTTSGVKEEEVLAVRGAKKEEASAVDVGVKKEEERKSSIARHQPPSITEGRALKSGSRVAMEVKKVSDGLCYTLFATDD